MADLARWLAKAVQHLDEADARFALVGGLAVSLRTEPRFTRDIDFAVATASEAEAEAVLSVLIRYDYRTIAKLNRMSGQKLFVMRMAPPGANAGDIDSEEAPIIDLLFTASGIESEVVETATPLEVIPGTIVRVGTTASLLAMKLVSVRRTRRNDAVDIQALLGVAGPDEIAAARHLLRLVASRGYGDEKKLLRLLDRYRADLE